MQTLRLRRNYSIEKSFNVKMNYQVKKKIRFRYDHSLIQFHYWQSYIIVQREKFLLEIAEKMQINMRRYLVNDLSGNDSVKPREIFLSVSSGNISNMSQSKQMSLTKLNSSTKICSRALLLPLVFYLLSVVSKGKFMSVTPALVLPEISLPSSHFLGP